MKTTKKIVGLLLAGSMFISSLPAFAKVSVDKEGTTPEYEFGETVTITTDSKEAVRVYDSDKKLIVWGVSTLNDGEWTYDLKIPDADINTALTKILQIF